MFSRKSLLQIACALLFLLVVAGGTAASTGDEPTLELRFKVDVDYRDSEGTRRIEMAPRVKTLDDKKMELVLSEGHAQDLRLKVHPRLEKDGLINLEMELKARLNQNELRRRTKLSVPLSRPSVVTFEDEQSTVRIETFAFLVD